MEYKMVKQVLSEHGVEVVYHGTEVQARGRKHVVFVNKISTTWDMITWGKRNLKGFDYDGGRTFRYFEPQLRLTVNEVDALLNDGNPLSIEEEDEQDAAWNKIRKWHNENAD